VKAVPSFKLRLTQSRITKDVELKGEASCPKLLLSQGSTKSVTSKHICLYSTPKVRVPGHKSKLRLNVQPVNQAAETSLPSQLEPSKQTETSIMWAAYSSPQERGRPQFTTTGSETKRSLLNVSTQRGTEKDGAPPTSRENTTQGTLSKEVLPKIKGIIEFSKQPGRWRVAKPSQLRNTEYCPNYSAVLPRAGKGVIPFGQEKPPQQTRIDFGSTAMLLHKIREQRQASLKLQE
jgi:hypothetical protein